MSGCTVANLIRSQLREVEACEGVTVGDVEETPGGDGTRFRLGIGHCGETLLWLVECLPGGIDITPLDARMPLPDAFDLFTLEAVPSLATWTAERSDGIVNLCRELRGVFSRHHRRLAEDHPNKKVPLSLDAVKHHDRLECLVTVSAVHLRFPLFGPAAAISDPRLLPIMIHAKIPCGPHGTDGGATAEVALAGVPGNMRLTGTLQPAPWDLDLSLWDYLPRVASSVATGTAKRREFLQALAQSFSALEVDGADWSQAVLLVKSRAPKSKVVRLLSFNLGLHFPEQPPLMKLLEFQGSRTWPLAPQAYRYSPRWTVHRMAEELLSHALDESNVPAAWTA